MTLLRIPAGDVRQADGGTTAGKAGAEPRREYHWECGRIGDEPSRDRRDDHHAKKKPSSAVPVGPNAKRDAHQRARQKRSADKQPEFGVR